MIFVNFKTYRQGTGEKALELAKICQEVKEQEKVEIIPVVQAADIYRLGKAVSLPVWTQHIDNIEFGPNTGSLLPEAIREAGASGTILNHSENKLPFEVIKETIGRLKDLSMRVLVCSESIEEGKKIAEFKPDFLAYEPPELIGNREISVSTAKPRVLADFVAKFSQIPVIVGAGIHSFTDVKIALKLGAMGVLVATDVVLAGDQKKELTELAKGFK